MTFVFFIYGLSFFVLGLSILIYPKRGSAFKLATHLYLVAAFGLIHGVNEWVDMFIRIGESAPGLLVGNEWIFFLEAFRMVLLPGSFLCLVWFGVRVIAESKAGFSAMKPLPVLLPALWVVLFIASRERLVMGDISARYLLCFPGALLTAYSLILCLAQFEKAGLSVVVRYLKLAAAVFFVYGVLAGLIVKKAGFFPASVLNYDVVREAFGVPVQVLRAGCAVILAYCMLRVLGVFRWETQNALRELERNRREMIKTKHLTELGAVSTVMSQELDRPLKVAQLLLERLLSDIRSSGDVEAMTKTLKKGLAEVSEAVSILTRFRGFAHLSPITEARPIDLCRSAARIIDVCAEGAARANVQLAAEDLDVVISTVVPEKELEYIFLALIQDAVDAADGGRTKRLTVKCEIQDKQMLLTFADSCRIIPDERLRDVFRPFFATRPNGRGAQLSLAIVNHIVNTYGGAVSVESEPGKGTTFCVTLPIE